MVMVSRRHPLGTTWRRIREQCNNPRSKRYHACGGRGIKVCARWDDFENFVNDIGQRPSDRHYFVRIDQDKDYEPGNCRWATRSEMGPKLRGGTNPELYKAFGREMTLQEWAIEYKIEYQSLWARIKKTKWPLEKALTTPIRKRSPPKKVKGRSLRARNAKQYEMNGVFKSLGEWCSDYNQSTSLARGRIRRSWTLEDALKIAPAIRSKIPMDHGLASRWTSIRSYDMCEHWQSFENFANDVGLPPSEDHVYLMRINKEKKYGPANVRWVTRSDLYKAIREKKSSKNSSWEKNYEAFGESKTLKEWAKEYKIKFKTLHCRMARTSSLEEALTTPVDKNKSYTYEGETKSITLWALHWGIDKKILWQRLNRGWSIERALNTPIKKKNASKR